MNTVIVRELLDTDQRSRDPETPDVSLLWRSTAVERASYGGKEDIDGFSTSSKHLEYSLFTRPSIQDPERWLIKGHVVRKGMPARSGFFGLLAHRRRRTSVYEMLIGETFASAEEAMAAAEAWLGRALQGTLHPGDVRLTALD